MPMNRVEFHKGLSLPEFMERYGTEAQCEQALVAGCEQTGDRKPAANSRGVLARADRTTSPERTEHRGLLPRAAHSQSNVLLEALAPGSDALTPPR